MANETKFQFKSRIELITGSKKFRTKAQWPVSVIYSMDSGEAKVEQVFWDQCNGQPMKDITELLQPGQILGLENEIQDLFWKSKT